MSHGNSSADRPILKLKRAAEVFLHWKVTHSESLPYLPTEISFEVTNRCNFKCDFCPQSSPQHFERVPPGQLEPPELRRMLGKLRAAGLATRTLHWTLDGEPFMHKRFEQLIQTAGEYDFTTHHFATNGYFVSAARLRQFPGGKHRYFLTPDFCADREYFESVRGTAGSWQRVLDNLRSVLSAPDLSRFHLKITDIASYKEQDEELLRKRFKELKALFPDSPRVTFLQRAFHNATGFSQTENKVDVGVERLKRTPKASVPRAGYRLCPYPWFSFVVASNGEVVACCRDLEHKTVLGNLLTQEFDEIWNGEPYQELRRALVNRDPGKIAACARCDMPYDPSKGTLRHLARSAIHRMLLLEK